MREDGESCPPRVPRVASARHVRAVVKLGGSVVTDKARYMTAQPAGIRECARLVQALCEVEAHSRSDDVGGVIVCHGAGSAGHPTAKRCRVSAGWAAEPRGEAEGVPAEVVRGVAATRVEVQLLNLVLARCLGAGEVDEELDQGDAREGGARGAGMSDALSTRWMLGMVDGMRIPMVGLSPMSGDAVMGLHADPAAALSSATLGAVKRCLGNGLVPLLHGDVVFHRTKGCSILSADTIVQQCAREFRARWIMWATDTPVKDRPPGVPGARTIEEIEVNEFGEVTRLVLHDEDCAAFEVPQPLTSVIQTHAEANGAADVTGGMLGKLEAAVRCAVEAGRGEGRAEVVIGTPAELTRWVKAFGRGVVCRVVLMNQL